MARKSALIAAGDVDESKAIREIERLGGSVKRDGTLPGRPTTAVGFRFDNRFGDRSIYLLRKLTNPSMK